MHPGKRRRDHIRVKEREPIKGELLDSCGSREDIRESLEKDSTANECGLATVKGTNESGIRRHDSRTFGKHAARGKAGEGMDAWKEKGERGERELAGSDGGATATNYKLLQ